MTQPDATPSLARLGRACAGLPLQALLLVVRGYRLLLKPWLGNACRFEPSCSAYTLQALKSHGALRGSALGGWRLVRCQPWCAAGHDPVPAHFSLRAAARGRLSAVVSVMRGRAGVAVRPASEPAAGLFTALLDPPSSAPAPDATPAPVSPRTPS